VEEEVDIFRSSAISVKGKKSRVQKTRTEERLRKKQEMEDQICAKVKRKKN